MVDSAAVAVKAFLDALGLDDGEHTANTPARVAAAYRDMLWGYQDDPAQHLDTTFPAPNDPGVIIQAGIDIQSMCAHHLLPFQGHATVAYRPKPGQRIVGLSKLTRVVYGFAARIQVQERIGQQVVDAVYSKLSPEECVCIITASHDCIRLRGARSPASLTTTVATRGDVKPENLAFIQRLHLGVAS